MSGMGGGEKFDNSEADTTVCACYKGNLLRGGWHYECI